MSLRNFLHFSVKWDSNGKCFAAQYVTFTKSQFREERGNSYRESIEMCFISHKSWFLRVTLINLKVYTVDIRQPDIKCISVNKSQKCFSSRGNDVKSKKKKSKRLICFIYLFFVFLFLQQKTKKD